ncbi:hypothetical protein JTB14_004494 [Gonioctena quinquepunctata]|nr:hypothetical protein JTB14_004494 [Gonioctena quinquepunctata]
MDLFPLIATILSLAPSNDTVIVVRKDVDLLVISIDLCQANGVFFSRPGKDKVPSPTHSPLEATTSPVEEHILLLYAMSGCDTTLVIFKKSKTELFGILANIPSLASIVQTQTPQKK